MRGAGKSPTLNRMTCPKCNAPMMTVERDGVHIEQCERCRGIFLDRGELEHILDAEQRHYGSAPPYAGGGYRPDSPGPYRGGRPDSPGPYRGGRPDSPDGYRGGRYPDSPGPYGHRRGRRRSFLEGLFD